MKGDRATISPVTARAHIDIDVIDGTHSWTMGSYRHNDATPKSSIPATPHVSQQNNGSGRDESEEISRRTNVATCVGSNYA